MEPLPTSRGSCSGSGSGHGGGASLRAAESAPNILLTNGGGKKAATTPRSEKMHFRQYLWSEILGGYFDNKEETSSHGGSGGGFGGGMRYREDIYNFFAVPLELERLLLFGLTICLDTFLFFFTFFPIRVAVAMAHLVKKVIRPSTTQLVTSQVFDLLRAVMCLICFLVLQFTDASVLYHFIRGQAALKLYVIFNVLEIFDRLCCSFGQDLLDAMFCILLPNSGDTDVDADDNHSIREGGGSTPDDSGSGGVLKPNKKPKLKQFGPVVSFIIATVYTVVHSFLLFVKVVTLNVAINAYNNALLTLLVSNNFVELKGSVFKNFKEENVFQIACSDMVERFQLLIFLAIVTAHNLNDLSWNVTHDTLEEGIYVISLVWMMEVLVDWIKHAFITKFNRIDAHVYSKFYKIIAREIINTKRQSIPDTSHNISRRIGFVPLPLAVLVARVFVSIAPWSRSAAPFAFLDVMWVVALWASLCVIKVLTTLILLGKSLKHLQSGTNDDNGDQKTKTKDKAYHDQEEGIHRIVPTAGMASKLKPASNANTRISTTTDHIDNNKAAIAAEIQSNNIAVTAIGTLIDPPRRLCFDDK